MGCEILPPPLQIGTVSGVDVNVKFSSRWVRRKHNPQVQGQSDIVGSYREVLCDKEENQGK